jgi:hypothetical protein
MNRVCSIFTQVLHFNPRLEFGAGRSEARGGNVIPEDSVVGPILVAMLFCQLGRSTVAAGDCGRNGGARRHLQHLGVDNAFGD